MDPERITLRASDPEGPSLVGEGTIGSRSMMAHGGALLVAAREVVRKGTELAAKELEVAPNDLEFTRGRYRVKGTDLSIGIEDLAKKYRSALDSGGEIPLPRSFPSGAHVAEVEIDPETGPAGAVPAAANAVIDALRPLGIHHLDFPYTPDRVWHAIRAAKPGGG